VGREWDALLHATATAALVNLDEHHARRCYQTYKTNDGAYVRDHFFAP